MNLLVNFAAFVVAGHSIVLTLSPSDSDSKPDKMILISVNNTPLSFAKVLHLCRKWISSSTSFSGPHLHSLSLSTVPLYLPLSTSNLWEEVRNLIAVVNIFYVEFRLKTGLESSVESQLIVIKPIIAYIFVTYFILEEKVKLWLKSVQNTSSDTFIRHSCLAENYKIQAVQWEIAFNTFLV